MMDESFYPHKNFDVGSRNHRRSDKVENGMGVSFLFLLFLFRNWWPNEPNSPLDSPHNQFLLLCRSFFLRNARVLKNNVLKSFLVSDRLLARTSSLTCSTFGMFMPSRWYTRKYLSLEIRKNSLPGNVHVSWQT